MHKDDKQIAINLGKTVLAMIALTAFLIFLANWAG